MNTTFLHSVFARRRGFTLLEIIIVVGAMLFLIAAGFATVPLLGQQTDLNTASELVYSTFTKARAQTLSSEQNSQYGVHIGTSTVVLFKGGAYSAGDPNNKVFSLPEGVEIYATALQGGGSDVVFVQLTGETNQYGSVSLRLLSDTTKIKNVAIEKTGSLRVE